MIPSSKTNLLLLFLTFSPGTPGAFGSHFRHKRDLADTFAHMSLNQPNYHHQPADGPRLFSYITHLQESFSTLPESEAGIQNHLPSIVDRVVRQHHPQQPLLTSQGEQGFYYGHLAGETVTHLWNVRKLLDRFAAETEPILYHHGKTIEEDLLPHLSLDSNPIPRLARGLADYHSNQLQFTQNGIANLIYQFHLQGYYEDSQYLSRAFGLFGPDNILRKAVIEMLENPSVRMSFHLPESFNLDLFEEHISSLNGDIVEPLIKFLGVPNAAREEPELSHDVWNALSQFNQIYHYYNRKLEEGELGEGGLARLIFNIENSELITSFRRDYTSPINRAGEELALLAPWNLNFNIDHLLPGMGVSEDALKNTHDDVHDGFYEQTMCANQNTVCRLEIALQARKFIGQLLEQFTPSGLAVLTNELKSLSLRRWAATLQKARSVARYATKSA